MGVESGVDARDRRTPQARPPPRAGRLHEPGDGVQLVAVERRQGGAHRGDGVGPPGSGLCEREAQHLEAGPVVEQQLQGRLRVDGRPELQHHAQVVGQLGVGVGQFDARAPVRLLEPHEGDPALAGVAVGEVGQVRRTSAGVVERLDVLAAAACRDRCRRGRRRAVAAACPVLAEAAAPRHAAPAGGPARPRRDSRAAADAHCQVARIASRSTGSAAALRRRSASLIGAGPHRRRGTARRACPCRPS